MSTILNTTAETNETLTLGEASEPTTEKATTYFFIVAKAQTTDRRLLVISAHDGDANVIVSTQQFGNDLQLWEKVPTRTQDGKTYALVNKKTKKCLARSENTNRTPLVLASLDRINWDDLAVWRDDHVAGTYNAINSLADWQQKINIPGRGPYTPGQQLISYKWCDGDPNELWVFNQENKQVRIKHIDFDMGLANIAEQEPVLGATQIVSNYSGSPQNQTVHLTYKSSHSYQFTSETGMTIGEEVEFEGGIPLIEKAKVVMKVEGTWKLASERAQTDEQELAIDVPVTLPPNSRFEVSCMLLRACVDVPFEAVLEIVYNNQPPIEQRYAGRFEGVNTYTVMTNYRQL